MNDPRMRYRVEFDKALECGEVDEVLLAKGECEPWNNYLRAAELCERAAEEWELDRVAVRGIGLQRLDVMTPLGAIEIAPSPWLTGSDGYLLGNQFHVPQAMAVRLMTAATLWPNAPTPVAEELERVQTIILDAASAGTI